MPTPGSIRCGVKLAYLKEWRRRNPDRAHAIVRVSFHKRRVQIGSDSFTSAEWRNLYADGTVTKWLQQVSDFFVRFANISNATPASQYFDTKPYLETIKA